MVVISVVLSAAFVGHGTLMFRYGGKVIRVEAVPAYNLVHTRAGGQPYHFGRTDPQALVRLLAGEDGIEVRVREMQ